MNFLPSKITLLASIAAFNFFVLPFSAEAGTLRVYLLGGQSNAAGQAWQYEEGAFATSGTPTLPGNLNDPQTNVDMFTHVFGARAIRDRIGNPDYTAQQQANAQNNLDNNYKDKIVVPLQPVQQEVAFGYGPEITFGHEMDKYYSMNPSTPDTSVAIIKYAHFNTSMAEDWFAGNDPNSTADDGLDYQIFQEHVAEGLAALAAANPGDTIEVAGMIWLQGEADAGVARLPNYKQNTENFIADIRTQYGANLPFVIGEIGGRDNAAWDTIRDIQAQIATEDPYTGFAGTSGWGRSDVEIFNQNGASDTNLHYNPLGQQLMGETMATEIIALEQVPEPTTLGLLTFGSLLLLRPGRRNI